MYDPSIESATYTPDTGGTHTICVRPEGSAAGCAGAPATPVDPTGPGGGGSSSPVPAAPPAVPVPGRPDYTG